MSVGRVAFGRAGFPCGKVRSGGVGAPAGGAARGGPSVEVIERERAGSAQERRGTATAVQPGRDGRPMESPRWANGVASRDLPAARPVLRGAILLAVGLGFVVLLAILREAVVPLGVWARRQHLVGRGRVAAAKEFAVRLLALLPFGVRLRALLVAVAIALCHRYSSVVWRCPRGDVADQGLMGGSAPGVAGRGGIAETSP